MSEMNTVQNAPQKSPAHDVPSPVQDDLENVPSPANESQKTPAHDVPSPVQGKTPAPNKTNFKDWVPARLQFWVYLFILLIFQVCNGFYFAAMAQISGEWSLTDNQVHFLGETVLLGLAFYFPWAFKLKFRFTNQTGLLIAALGLALINLVFPYLKSYPLMVLLCYVGGFLHLYGTFECLSNLLPKITPTYNYAVFLSFVFFTVLGVLQLIDFAEIHIIYYYDWQQLHKLSVGLCLIVALIAVALMRPFREMPKMPLLGTDPLGMLLWSLTVLGIIYVLQFGEQYNWLEDGRIRAGIGVVCICGALAVERMLRIRHPFIDPEAFKSPNLVYMLGLFLALDVLISSQTVLQNAFTGNILGYDALTNSRLLIPRFLGAATAALFCWQARTRLKFQLKSLVFYSMGAMVLYDVAMLGCLSPAVNIEKLYLPAFLLGFGHVGVFISVTVYAQAYSKFKYYFQVICLLGFVRMGIGEPLGCAVWGHALNASMGKYLGLVGATADWTTAQPDEVVSQALMSALRDLYGAAVVFGVVVLIAILLGHFDRVRNPLPKLKQIYIILSKTMNKIPLIVLLGCAAAPAFAQRDFALQPAPASQFAPQPAAQLEAQPASQPASQPADKFTLPAGAETFPLSRLFDSAEHHNKTLKVYNTAYKMAEEGVKDAKFAYLPDIDLNLAVSYNGDGWVMDRYFSNGSRAPIPDFGNNFSLKVSQVIYAGGAIANRVKMEQLGQRMAELDLQRNRQEVRFLIAGTYLDLYKALNTLQVLEKNIALAEDVLREMQNRYASGVALENDITRYELRLANLRLQKESVADRYYILNHRLCNYTGLAKGTFILPDTTLLQQSFEPGGEDYWQTQALSGNYALKQAALSVEMAERELALSKAGTRPNLFLFAEDDLMGPVTIEIPALNNNFNYWYVGLGLQYRIGETYKTMHKIRQAKQKQTQAGEQYDVACEQMDMGVQAACTHLATAYTEVSTHEKQVALADQNYAVINNRYENGLAILTDLLDAANTRLSAELSLVDARIDLIYNYLQLKYLANTL